MNPNTRAKLDSAVVGSRIWFEGESQPYRVRARDERYIICTKPFNLKKTVLYSVIDLEEMRRGPDNNIFCCGYETEDQIEANMKEFRERTLEVSRRRGIDLAVNAVTI